MSFKIFIDSRAADDIDNAYDWYEQQQPGLGDLFLEELIEYYEKLEQNPDIFSRVNEQYRQASLQRFQRFRYVILYEVNNRDVFIDAIFHTSRNPAEKLRKRNH